MNAMRIAWLLLCLPHAALAAPWLRSEGVATSSQGRILYREVHWRRDASEGAERWVLYQCPGGQPFARKHLPASPFAQARGYSLQDRRSGQTAEIETASGAVSVAWKEDAASPPRQRRLDLPPDAVIDAGFDAAVRLHWTALMQGERISLPFLVPGRQRYFPVQVRHTGTLRWQGIDAQSIEVSLDTWYGGIAPRLSLVYASADRHLRIGAARIAQVAGAVEFQQAAVRFGSPPAQRPASEWQQAWAQPLVDRCPVTNT
jgi:hypothetical protein